MGKSRNCEIRKQKWAPRPQDYGTTGLPEKAEIAKAESRNEKTRDVKWVKSLNREARR
jgi:hypothetical protein